MKEIEVGRVVDYFGKVGVASIEITAEEIKIGDTLHFKGHTTDFNQAIDSMEIEHEQVEKVNIGANVGIKVNNRVRNRDKVYRIVED